MIEHQTEEQKEEQCITAIWKLTQRLAEERGEVWEGMPEQRRETWKDSLINALHTIAAHTNGPMLGSTVYYALSRTITIGWKGLSTEVQAIYDSAVLAFYYVTQDRERKQRGL